LVDVPPLEFSERSSVLLLTLDTFEDISRVFSTHFCHVFVH
jgi:hypothetical protein